MEAQELVLSWPQLPEADGRRGVDGWRVPFAAPQSQCQPQGWEEAAAACSAFGFAFSLSAHTGTGTRGNLTGTGIQGSLRQVLTYLQRVFAALSPREAAFFFPL